MLKVIAFDYGGVLGTEANDWSKTFKNVLEAANLSLEEMDEIWERHWQFVSTGKEEIKEYWKDASEKNHIDPEKLRQLYNSDITLNEKVFEFAKSLKKDHKLIIISNDTKDWMAAKIARFKLDEVFEKIYCSATVGIRKPNNEIFELVLKEENIKPEELLLIDNQENNISAAKNLGILTLLFSNQTHTIADIKKGYENIIRNIK